MPLSVPRFQERIGRDRFKFDKVLGQGATGGVFEAHDLVRGHRVALKALGKVEPDALVRFKREFRTLADVSHPNLVTLYELVSSQDEWFFTMELVEGKTFLAHAWGAGEPIDEAVDRDAPTLRLDDFGKSCRAESLSAAQDVGSDPGGSAGRFDRLRTASLQLAQALDALHRRGHLHRDVKPSNVLVSSEERVVVLDFGIIADLRTPRHLGGDDAAVLGTPAYMAPEQMRRGVALSPAADWYAFGVMLYEALTGVLPFDGSVREIVRAKRRRDPRPAAEYAPGAPADLADLCDRLLNRRPERRPDISSPARSARPPRGYLSARRR